MNPLCVHPSLRNPLSRPPPRPPPDVPFLSVTGGGGRGVVTLATPADNVAHATGVIIHSSTIHHPLVSSLQRLPHTCDPGRHEHTRIYLGGGRSHKTDTKRRHGDNRANLGGHRHTRRLKWTRTHEDKPKRTWVHKETLKST